MLFLAFFAADPSAAARAQVFGGLEDRIAMHEVVIEGRVITFERIVRPFGDGCGLGTTRLWEAAIRVHEVIVGGIPDSTVRLMIQDEPALDAGTLVPGDRVLAYANRHCDDGSQLWGKALAIDGNSLDLSILHRELLGGRTTAPWKRFHATLLKKRVRTSSASFEGKTAIALLGITKLTVLAPGRISLDCDSLGWVLGRLPAVPKEIVFRRIPSCFFPAAPAGDTIVIALDASRPRSTLELSECPRGLLVENGRVPSLGVSLSDLSEAVEITSKGLRLRRVHASR